MQLIENIARRLKMSETKTHIATNVFWAVLGKFVNLLSALVVGIMVARYLGPEQYGLMNYVVSYVVLFQIFSWFGLDSIEIREESRGAVPFHTVIGTAFAVKSFLSIVFMALVIGTSYLTNADLFTTVLVAIYALTIPLNTFNVIRNYFTAIVQNEYVVKVEIARTLIGMCIKLVLLYVDATLIWFVTFSMFDYVLTSSGYIAAYHSKIGKIRDWHFDFAYSRYLVKEGFPLLLTSAAVIVYQRIDQVMIGQMIDKESVGYFAVASRFVDILIYIPMILAQTVMPVLVRQLAQGQEVYKKKAQQFMNVSFWLSILAASLTSLLAYWLVIILFGEKYLPAVIILQVMAFKAASVALSNTAGAMLVAEGLQKYAMYRDIIGCIVCVTLNYILLPRYGIIASAFVVIISNVSAGYLADAIIPAYRHLFLMQTKTLLVGWKDIVSIRTILKR